MANPSPSWSAVSQRPTTGQDDHGRYVQGQEVRIRTGMGHEGLVFIPYDILGTDKGKQKMAALAVRLDATGSASG